MIYVQGDAVVLFIEKLENIFAFQALEIDIDIFLKFSFYCHHDNSSEPWATYMKLSFRTFCYIGLS